eukprot:scaffold888_cov569-Prasinococcus_capsulatus_cf.AAC.5
MQRHMHAAHRHRLRGASTPARVDHTTAAAGAGGAALERRDARSCRAARTYGVRRGPSHIRAAPGRVCSR